MVDTKAIVATWSYINEFDKTGQPGYLITAWVVFKGVLDQTEIPEDFKAGAWELDIRGREYWATGVEVDKKSLLPFCSRWIRNLFEHQHPFVYQVAKASLIKILTALGYLVTPREIEEGVLEDLEL